MEAIDILLDYIGRNFSDDSFYRNGIHYCKNLRTKKSFSRWAAYEIVSLVMDNPSRDALSVIEEFRCQMIFYIGMATGGSALSTLMFQTAYETAEELAALL